LSERRAWRALRAFTPEPVRAEFAQSKPSPVDRHENALDAFRSKRRGKYADYPLVCLLVRKRSDSVDPTLLLDNRLSTAIQFVASGSRHNAG
jgi:hypothetical protein